MAPTAVDLTAFRGALSRFASGVTVLTTRTADGRDAGMTATAFTSLSLDPPLVLACVDRTASMHSPLQDATHLAVHVLAAGEEALSRRFAGDEAQRFRAAELTRGIAGLPLLDGWIARLQCRITARHPEGDHVIIVGEVLAAEVAEGDPLLYFGGRYGGLAR